MDLGIVRTARGWPIAPMGGRAAVGATEVAGEGAAAHERLQRPPRGPARAEGGGEGGEEGRGPRPPPGSRGGTREGGRRIRWQRRARGLGEMGGVWNVAETPETATLLADGRTSRMLMLHPSRNFPLFVFFSFWEGTTNTCGLRVYPGGGRVAGRRRRCKGAGGGGRGPSARRPAPGPPTPATAAEATAATRASGCGG